MLYDSLLRYENPPPALPPSWPLAPKIWPSSAAKPPSFVMGADELYAWAQGRNTPFRVGEVKWAFPRLKSYSSIYEALDRPREQN